jgi:protein TonB
MKNSKKNFNSVGQNTTEVKKSQKHDANLQKNSTLYFQIGLILCLLGTYSLFEMQFQDKAIIPDSVTINEVATIDVAPNYRVEVQQKLEPKKKVVRSTTIIDKFKEVKDDTPEIEDKLFTPDALEPTNDPVDPNDIVVVDIPDPVDVPIEFIEKVPVYPGCERKKTNEDKRKCMSQKLIKLIGKKFDTSIGEEYGISGLQKIQTQFTVDKNGNISNIKVRSSHPALDKEAKRVLNKIPQMKPGYQGVKPVGVIYTLPITYEARY